jgi:copper transport protein
MTAALLLGSALPASPAGAHAVPATADPASNARLDASPREAVVRFTERVEARPSTLEVLDARGQRVDLGGAAVDPADPWRYRVGLPPLPEGAYTVSWRVLSADDGHVTSGAHAFTVGAVSSPVGTVGESGSTVRSGAGWRPLARWLVAVGGALLLGALVASPSLGLGGAPWIGGMETLGAIAVAGGGTLDLALQAHALAGGRPLAGVLATLVGTPPGLVWIGRSGLVALLLLVRALPGSRAPAGPAAGRWWFRVALAASVVMTGGLVSHGAAVPEGRWLALGAEALHLLAMASWVGGLFAFATVFWRTRPASASGSPDAWTALAIPAFSRIAVVAVGSVAVSGLVLARFHLTSWSAMVGTAYGRWLTAKIAVFAAMLALGAWHQMWLAPRLTRALAARETAPEAVLAFRRSVRREATLGLVALGLAGALGVTAPPAPPAAAPPGAAPAFRHERTFDEARVRLEVTPLHPGPNAIRLTVTDPAGRPLADAIAAMVQVTPVDASVGAVTFQLDRAAPGVFVAPSAALGLVGRWSGRLVVQRTNAYDVNDRFELVVAEGAAAGGSHGAHAANAGQPPESTAPAPRGTPFDRVTAGAALTIAAVTFALVLRSRRRLEAVRRLLIDTPQPPAPAPAPR